MNEEQCLLQLAPRKARKIPSKEKKNAGSMFSKDIIFFNVKCSESLALLRKWLMLRLSSMRGVRMNLYRSKGNISSMF